MSGQRILGALVGWKREPSEHGIIISLQILAPEDAGQILETCRVSVALNDRQLRSLTRDLERASAERGIKLWATRRWLRFF